MTKKSPKQRLKGKCVALAIANYRLGHPYCELCGQTAHTCHHFIHQSKSNYLRLDERNLVAICKSCHCLMHHGHEQIFTGQLIKKRGMKWFDAMERDKTKTIKDNLTYWRGKLNELGRANGAKRI